MIMEHPLFHRYGGDLLTKTNRVIVINQPIPVPYQENNTEVH